MLLLENIKILYEMTTNKGENVAILSEKSPTMIVFLRHLGCMFCKETLADLQNKKQEILAKGTQIVFVHMTEPEIARDFFEKYDLHDIHHVSDPDSKYYSAFGLGKGTFKQLFGFKSWYGMGRAVSKGNLPQRTAVGDPSQMPGIFLLYDKTILKSFIYKSIGDYPDYLSIATYE